MMPADACLPLTRGTPLLRARGLTKIYGTGEVAVHALRGIDIDLDRGEIFVIVGPSGSGKSTLFNLLGGLDEPTAGELAYRGRDLRRMDDSELTQYRCDHVGFVFQLYNLISALTARQNVALVSDLVRRSMPPEEALRLVGLEGRLDHYPSQLSGGEQQRIAIARAIAKLPDLLLCDEPTGALDVATGRVVLDALVRVSREIGATTGLITHNAAVGAIADRVVHLSSGRILRVERNERKVPAAELEW
jgi:putative ABC transport system ATP-binding protein